MKPTKMRNRLIYRPPKHTQSKALGTLLSKDLRQRYNRRSMRIREGDSVKILRGEYKGVEGKVSEVSVEKHGVAVEGIKREKVKGDSINVFINSSNMIITALNLEEKWRQAKAEKKKPREEIKKKKESAAKREKDSQAENGTTKSKKRVKEKMSLSSSGTNKQNSEEKKPHENNNGEIYNRKT